MTALRKTEARRHGNGAGLGCNAIMTDWLHEHSDATAFTDSACFPNDVATLIAAGTADKAW